MIRNLMPWRKKIQNEIMPFRNQISTDVDHFFSTLLFSPYGRLPKGKRFPSINVMNGEKKITVEAELPGVNSKDIDITLNGRRLSIHAERKDKKKEERSNFHRMEISYGSYSRVVELPADVDQSNVDADYKNGVLKIKLKKTKASQTKMIKIRS